ncbi:protein FAM98A isoform X1 [Harmonia axyridis]|uniref:protein FAM98A isoform X1 n=1 Tax=Harmonia axyridis TaxID=115357 RepID=UPI001E2796CF|nr:protein FAM98A isoform X1 [Harmonia axyridis]
MEAKIITGLQDIGYQGNLLQKQNLRNSIQYGSKSIEYTKLVSYLTNEIRTLSKLDEKVNPISSPEDSISFMMEISSFLKEMSCPYQSLTQGHVSDRLQNVEQTGLLLDYLITELMIARMNQENAPKTKLELKLQETPEADNLKQILQAMNFPEPPPDLTFQRLFSKVIARIEDIFKKMGNRFVGKTFFSGFLSDKQWMILDQLEKDLNNDYKIRREMLLTRLDVTIQSFQWSDRVKGKEGYFQSYHKDERKKLCGQPNVDLSHLLAARTDLVIIEKTSSANVRKNTKTSIQKVIIGKVPDRGGRTNEIAPPLPEMPSWQQRTTDPHGGGRGGYNNARGRGSYNRNASQQSNFKGDAPLNSGRGNDSFGKSTNSDKFKSSLDSSIRSNRPFSNFNTSLKMYSSYSFSNLGNSSIKPGYSGSSDFANSEKDCYSKDRRDLSMNYESSDSRDYSNKRLKTTYGSCNKDLQTNNYSQKRSFNIAGDNEERGYHNSRTNSGNYGGDRQSNYTAYESAASYDSNKRIKSYDSFKTENTSYSDQYVRDTQHNHQNQSRNENLRGRSNYRRGQGNRYKR